MVWVSHGFQSHPFHIFRTHQVVGQSRDVYDEDFEPQAAAGQMWPSAGVVGRPVTIFTCKKVSHENATTKNGTNTLIIETHQKQEYD